MNFSAYVSCRKRCSVEARSTQLVPALAAPDENQGRVLEGLAQERYDLVASDSKFAIRNPLRLHVCQTRTRSFRLCAAVYREIACTHDYMACDSCD